MTGLHKYTHEPYLIINVVFAGIVAVILLYSGFFSASENNYPVPCVHQQLLGRSCASCGMSRAFSESVRLNFTEAASYNKSALPIFFFFVGQFAMRILLSGWYFFGRTNKIVFFDVAITILWFIFAWHKLIYDSWLLHLYYAQ